jgi:hypothetical protein
LSGQWLGYSVLDSSLFNRDIYLKNETINDAKLIIIMSRHTVFQKDNLIYVVPTADIDRFRSAAASEKK